jgi:hypothetical protein
MFGTRRNRNHNHKENHTMKTTLRLTAILMLCLFGIVHAAGLLENNDQHMNGSWTFNKAVTITGTTTLNGALVVAGATTYTGAPTFASAVTLDDGVTDSPILTLQCAGDKTLAIQKLDAGGATITNNEGAIALMPSNDVDDYISISTASNVPSIATIGACNLDLAPMGSLNIKASGDADDYLIISTSGNVPQISTANTSNLLIAPTGGQTNFTGTVIASGDIWAYDGVGNSPIIQVTDGDVKSLKLSKLDAGDGLILNDEGGLQFQLGNDTDDYLTITTAANVPTIATAGAANLTIAPDGGTTNVTGALTVSGAITGGSYISRITQTVAFGDFTDNTDPTGYIDLTTKLPAGSLVVGWRAVVTTGFTGDTTAVVQVGKAGSLAAYSTVTSGSVLAAATVGSASVLATSFEGAETTVRVTVTGGADFTSISAGEMTITVFYAY